MRTNNTNLTVEQFKQLVGTQKLCFSIFRKTNKDTGAVETQYCHDAAGNNVTYKDAEGKEKPLPKVIVRDSANNIVAFCSASVSLKKLTGGKALEGSYFEARPQADGSVSYLLRNQASSEFDLGEE